MSKLTFGNSAALLRANGYAPAPIDSNSRPYGPYAAMQLAYSPDIYADDRVSVLASLPPPRSEHDAIQDHRAIALAALTIRTNVAVDELEKIVADYCEKRKCPVRMLSDGSKQYVFAVDGDVHLTQMSEDIDPIGVVRISSYGSFIDLGSPNEWRNGIDLFNTPRNKLPSLDAGRAAKLFNEIMECLNKHVPTPVTFERYVPKPILEPGQRLLFGNTRALHRLRENGFVLCPIAWGEQLPASINDPKAGVGLLAHPTRATFDNVKPERTGLAYVELKKIKRADIAAEINAVIDRHSSLSKCPTRTDSNGTTLRLFQWNASLIGKSLELRRGATNVDGYPIDDSFVDFRIVAGEPIVVSGTDKSGRLYDWQSTDWLTLRRDELPELDYSTSRQILSEIESMLWGGRFAKLPTTRIRKSS